MGKINDMRLRDRFNFKKSNVTLSIRLALVSACCAVIYDIDHIIPLQGGRWLHETWMVGTVLLGVLCIGIAVPLARRLYRKDWDINE